MFSLFPKKPFLAEADNKRVVEAIRAGENRTSGEIRVFIESKNPLVSTLDRAAHIFHQLQMHKTHHKNAVLIYVAAHHHELAIYADEGIYRAVGQDFWNREVAQMLTHFKENHLADGLILCIKDVGELLSEKFPYIPTEDKNELPDEIVFGH